jgi:tetratricopeptide (TPR) repeat protein
MREQYNERMNPENTHGTFRTFLASHFSSFYFPHISLNIPAHPKPLNLWRIVSLVCLGILIINLVYGYTKEPNTEERLSGYILRNPENAEVHEQLGFIYLSRNVQAANQEYSLAEEYYHDSDANSATESPLVRWDKYMTAKDQVLSDIKKWESFQTMFPDYVYAKKQLITLYTLVGNAEKADKENQEIILLNPEAGD